MGKTLLEQIIEAFPLQSLNGKEQLLVSGAEAAIDRAKRFLLHEAMQDAPKYGWVIGRVERLEEVVTAIVYLHNLESEVATVFMNGADPEKFGIAVRRFFMARRLNPDKLDELSVNSVPTDFLDKAKELIEVDTPKTT